MLVRLEKYLLLKSGIRTLGGETAFRRERSGVPHASPENPPGLGPCGVSDEVKLDLYAKTVLHSTCTHAERSPQ